MPEYNFQYLLNLHKEPELSYELRRIVNAVDKNLSDYKPNYLFHLVPILYSIVIASGLGIFVYTLTIG